MNKDSVKLTKLLKESSLNENGYVDVEDKLRALYDSYKADGMEESFWSDLINCIDNFEYVDNWYNSLEESAK